jgi:hypothetical protein
MRSTARLLLLAALGCVPLAAACSTAHSPPSAGVAGPTGQVGLSLTLSGGVTITSVDYQIWGPTNASGVIDVGDAQSIQFVVAGLAPGSGYTLRLHATDSNGDDCTGESNFAVTAGEVTDVGLVLQCVPPETGSVFIDATVNLPDASAGWSPGVVPGLVLWLDGSNGLSQGAGGGPAWSDQSGQRNDALPMGAPVIKPGAIGGRPAVHFNGGPDYLVVQDSSSLQFSTGDFVIAVVAAHTTPTTGMWGYGLFYSKQEQTAPYPGPGLVANTVNRTGQIEAQVALDTPSLILTTGADYNNGQPLYLTMHRFSRIDDGGTATATLDLRVNGADAGSISGPGAALDVSAAGQPLVLGGSAKAQGMVGDLAEVVAIKGAVSDADIDALEAYFRAKYGL